jgi:hypothetical protein
MVDGDFGRVNLRGVGQQPKLRVRLERIGDPVRDALRRRARRHDQIDVNRDGRRSRNDGRWRLSEKSLGRGSKGVSLDPHQFFSGGIENSHARQRHRLGEHADDEKFVFDVIHAVVAANDLGLVNRTNQDSRRPSVALSRRA